MQNELYRLTKDDPRFDMELRASLGHACNLKEIADYLTGPDSEFPTEQARHATTTAARLIDVIIALLA